MTMIVMNSDDRKHLCRRVSSAGGCCFPPENWMTSRGQLGPPRMGSFGETRLTETYIGVEYVGDLRYNGSRGNRFALV